LFYLIADLNLMMRA